MQKGKYPICYCRRTWTTLPGVHWPASYIYCQTHSSHVQRNRSAYSRSYHCPCRPYRLSTPGRDLNYAIDRNLSGNYSYWHRNVHKYNTDNCSPPTHSYDACRHSSHTCWSVPGCPYVSRPGYDKHNRSIHSVGCWNNPLCYTPYHVH